MPIYNTFILDQATNQPSAPGLQAVGPRVPVAVSIHPTLEAHLVKEGKPVPVAVSGVGLIDTGATFTSVDMSAIKSLGIAPIGTVSLGTASGPVQQNQYPAALSFPGTNLPSGQFGFVIGCDLTGQGILVLIGRDVLQNYVMLYHGPLGLFTLTI
jgi:hypothetical protein